MPNGATITLKRGDITTVRTDAVANAANAYLVPGGGVSGAIHRAAGPRLAEECDSIALKNGPLRTGEAVITAGFDLPSAHVIHVLGPVWEGGHSGEEDALAASYRHAIELADSNGLKSIAFPSISTGIFGYPKELAAPVALSAVAGALLRAATVRDALFVLFEESTFDAFAKAMEDL